MLDFLNSYFVSGGFLIMLVVAVLILLFLGFSDKRLFFTRLIVFVLLIFALAEPYSLENLFSGGSAELVVLDDNSVSFDLFEEDYGSQVYNKIKGSDVEYGIVGNDKISDIGDGIISKIKQGNNVLLISDGNINYGSDFGDVVVEAKKEDVSVSIIEPVLKEDDYSVKIMGPSKIGAGVHGVFEVVVKGTGNEKKPVVLYLDGKEVKKSFKDRFEYSEKFDSGYHKLRAEIKEDDFFGENNVYYKTVKVVKKPKVLFFGDSSSPLYKLISKVYDADVGDLYDLNKYYAVIIENKNVFEVEDRVDDLEEFVKDGNGLIVFGGKNSFEYGGYKGSGFEDLLPVIVSGVGKKEGNVNIILLIDISGSTGSGFGSVSDVEKSLAISAIDDIGNDNNLGVVAFDSDYYIVEGLGLLGKKNIEELKGKISQLTSGGSTEIGTGINQAIKMLGKQSGSKNIILISDGQTQKKDDAYSSVEEAIKNNIKIYSIGVGESQDAGFLNYMGNASGGGYFKGFQSSKIQFLFGDPSKKKGEGFDVLIEDEKHYITEDLILGSSVYGYNEVVPKNSAQLLISASGNPLVSVWRVGLGRIAVVSSDNGFGWSGELYSGSGSNLIKRTVSWSAGNPERKEKYFVEVGGAHVGEEVEIVVKGDKKPNFKGFNFDKKEKGIYVANVIHENPGFFELGSDEYSVNYNSEYEGVGFNEELKNLVVSTGGGIFKMENVLQEISGYLKVKKDILEDEKEPFIWPLVLLAMVIFLLDVWFEKVRERKNI